MPLLHPADERRLAAPDVFYIALPDAATGICPGGTFPIYRVFDNRADANHRYTSSTAIVDEMKTKGWIVEGYGPGPYYPIMCAPQWRAIAPRHRGVSIL